MDKNQQAKDAAVLEPKEKKKTRSGRREGGATKYKDQRRCVLLSLLNLSLRHP